MKKTPNNITVGQAGCREAPDVHDKHRAGGQ